MDVRHTRVLVPKLVIPNLATMIESSMTVICLFDVVLLNLKILGLQFHRVEPHKHT